MADLEKEVIADEILSQIGKLIISLEGLPVEYGLAKKLASTLRDLPSHKISLDKT